ncbi:MAG: hypothetical protein N4A33_08665 [Bacteriovoracaceae bacterium]|nr:hypothetical protein [Bacteriovoracaceae bacterium]
MKGKLHLGTRLLFGLAFFIFGINGFLQFMPTPPMTSQAGALMGAFAKTGYFFPMIKTLEILIGSMLLLNLYAPLATILITPILIGITTIHLFLNPAGLAMMLILHILHGIIVWGYKDHYKSLLIKKA